MDSDIKLRKIFCLLALLAVASPVGARVKGRAKDGSQSYSQRSRQSSQSDETYYQRDQAYQNYGDAYEPPFQRQQAAESHSAHESSFGQQQMSHNYGASRGGTSCSDRPRGPSNGSIRCQMTSEKNTCTGNCREGYSFPDGSTTAMVECFLRQGRWIPFKDFPSCTAIHGGGGSVRQHEMRQSLGSSSCVRPSFPSNAQMSCRETSYNMQCQATCNPGYEFPDGSRQVSLSCSFQEGRWIPLPAFQNCIRHCYPECENGGQCESNNVCLCTQEYRGNRCQYPVSYCDFSRLGSVMVAHDCFHTPEYTECHVSCPPGMTFDPPTPSVYRCTVDGHWNPPITPRCSSDMLCEPPPSPMNGKIQCSGNQDTMLCRATCNTGYSFPEGFLELSTQCSHRTGEWSPMPNFQDCEPMCHPECQHGGRCLGHNRCLCPREYRGSTCQYPTAECDGHTRFSGVAWNCEHNPHETVCQVNCGQTGLVLEPPSPTEYVCSLDGTWQPYAKPRCVESSHYRGGYEREHETQQEEDIGDFGSHTSDRDRERYHRDRVEQQTNDDTDVFGQQSIDEDEDFEDLYGQNTVDQEVSETDFDKTDRLIDPRSEPIPRVGEPLPNEEENEISLFPEQEQEVAQEITETEEPEVEEDKIHGFSEPSENKGICSVWGYHHYRTFDGLTFTFPGTCGYVLASDCDEGDVRIGLRHRCDSPSSSCDKAVEIHVPESQFFITPTVVLRNGEPSTIPIHVGTLTIEKISRYIVVKMTTGFIVWMDPDANVHITADNLMLRGKTCGLCGNNDGLSSNDPVSPDGQKLSSPITFGNSWELPDSGECVDASGLMTVCHSDTREGRATSSAASLLCTSLLDPEYQDCINLLDAEVYFRMCQMDCCSDPKEGCECHTFSQYFMECERQGGHLGEGWRRPAICPIQCSNGTEYQQCGPACPPTCSNLEPTCPVENCVDGCHCPSGSVMEDGVCIPLDQCPCHYGTRKYSSGEEMQQDCNTCSCVGGEWQCTDNICAATCSVSGPHFTTFDGLNYDLYSSCAHYLVKHPDFSISIEMTSDCYNSPLSVCVRSVIIHTPEGAVVKMKPGMEVTVNGQEVPSIPASAPGVYVTQATSVYMKAQMNTGLEVFWDGGASLRVTVPPELFRKLRGLCGTFSRSQTDDFLTPEGDTELTSATFTEKWKVDDNCVESFELLDAVDEEPCERTPRKRITAVDLCQALNGPIFSDCHSSVDQEPYYHSCLDDVCRCDLQPEHCLCESLANYAAACARKERFVSWRREVPECGFHCPVGQVYEECADSCMYSCSVIAGSSDCRKSCTEGCVCPQGLTLDENQQCVSVSSCSCMHSGYVYPPDFLQRRGREMCECSYGQWACRHATPSDIILTPPPNVAVHCSDAKNEEFTDCLSDCPLTCNNLHHHDPCTVSICSQGCKCKQGYVRDTQNNICVLPHECPCHHGGQSYEDGAEVKIDCNTCTCQGGEWKCDDNACPGLCSAWGETHYLTFDGKIYDFQGDCDYVLVRARAAEGEVFSVIIQNVPCGSGGTCSKSLIISLGEWSITLTREHPLPPVPPESRLTISQLGMFTLIHSDIGISVQWDQRTRIYVSAEPVWKGKLKGLCGDFNSDSSDDFRPPAGGMPLVRSKDFADTWRVHDYCSPSQHVTDTCESRPERRGWARHKCAVLKSELFQPCHSQVELEPYYSRCVYDACGCDKGGDCQCFCAAVATYAQECARQNVIIPWRSQELCPVQCEACDRYSPCISLCPPLTCDTLTENGESHSCNHEPCVEGCEPKPCKPGYVYKSLSNLTCIKEEECEEKPCAVINGISYREGERIKDDSVGDACQSCYCRNGGPDCIGVPCTSAATPTPVELLPECELTGWTEWIDTIDPEDNEGDDVENLRDLTLNHRIPCPLEHIRSIQCRVADTQAPSDTTDQGVICDLDYGLLCEHTSDEDCWNYEIRVYCDCVPEVTCAPGEEWHNCAYHCDSTCHSFEQDLHSSGVCTENQQCVPGCTSATCELPYVARDAETCVLPEMCTCRLNSGYLLAPGEVVSSGCEKCQCLNNSLLCSTLQECAPTTALETTPVTEHVTLRKKKARIGPGVLTPEECIDGWTIWINDHDPDSFGETEIVDDTTTYCPTGTITATECRDAALGQEYQLSGLTDIQCNLTGFYCLNSKQTAGRTCTDYKIRLYCDCVATTPGTTPSPRTSVIPPAAVPSKKPPPPVLPRLLIPTTISTTLACSYWSEWINNNKPRKGPASGEREDTLPFILQQTEGFCAEGTITEIECRDVKKNRDYKDTKEVNLVCDLHTGFLCKNGAQPDGRCLDYKIRYMCACVTPTPPSTTIIVGVPSPSFVLPCNEYRLIVDGSEPLSDTHLKASSSLSPKSGPQSSRLSSTYGLLSEGAWTAKTADDSQFLEVHLGEEDAIFGVVTKGRDDHNEWVTSYYILYSTDGITYSYYMDQNNMPKAFSGNFDSSSEVRHIFENPFEAKVVRIQPLTWEGHVSLRWDLIGCLYEEEARMILPLFPKPTPTPSVEVCQDPMGLENGLISDSQLSASSSYDSSLTPTNGRLGSEIAWAAAILSDDQYLQIDFMEPRNIAGVVTKGREDVPQWVTSYNVAYSNDGVTWNKVVDDTGGVKDFPGNYDQDSVVTNMLPSIVRTRYLRIIPKSWKNWISMQAEVLGCFHPYLCKDPMGIESGLVSNGQLSSSSVYDESLKAKSARLDSASAWAAETLSPNEFLQVDFLETQNLTGVVTKGRPDTAQWVAAYQVAYSDDGNTWNKIEDDKGGVQEFMGNSDSDTAVTNLFSDTIRARYLRVLPVRWKGWISMRIEVLGCYHPQVCQEPMGLENGLLSDSQLSASSSYDNYLVPSSARLEENTGWVPAAFDEDKYLQVDFLEPRNVSAIVTKGRGDAPQWVIAYKVAHSDDGQEFEDVVDEIGEPKEFKGNDDQDTPVVNVLPETIETRFLRIKPVSWKNEIGVRLEVLGCYHPYSCREPMGVESNAISDFQLTSSSNYDATLTPNAARLNSDTGWSAETLDENQYLQVDFITPQNVSAVVTQGRNDALQWVTEYVVAYSDDGETWTPLADEISGRQKEFVANYDSDSPVTNTFPEEITTRFLRIQPTKWKDWISLRFEILGCLHPSVCEMAMGLENGLLADSQISASSFKDSSVSPTEVRLDNEYSAWVPETLTDEFLQIDFIEPRNVSAVVTKGRPDEEQWVTSYKIMHSDDEEIWDYVEDGHGNPVVFDGNSDQNTPVISPLPELLNTRYLRIVPVGWNDWIGLRTEILGCYHPYPEIIAPPEVETVTPEEPWEAVLPLSFTVSTPGLAPECPDPNDEEVSLLTDDAFIAASSVAPGSKPSQIYLNTRSSKGLSGGWVPKGNDLHPVVTIMLPEAKLLTGIVIQGREDSDQWVKTFRVIASEDGQKWHPLFDPNGEEEMNGTQDRNSIEGFYFKEPVAAKIIKIIPETWNKRPSLRMDLRGCPHPFVGTTPGTTVVPPLVLCPEMEIELVTSCPNFCSPGLVCDGKNCVDPVDCSCVHDGKIFMVSDRIEDENCIQCDCALGGHSICSMKSCPPCDEGRKQILLKNCSCYCQECDDGEKLCPSSGECIPEERWCDGILDCPDDETHCITTLPPPPPEVTTPPPEKPENATCEILGRHITTLDGQELNYDICNHIVLQDIEDSDLIASLHKDCSAGNECRYWLKILHDGHDITVTSDLDVEFDGHEYTVSQLVLLNKNPLLNITIEKVGEQIIVKSTRKNVAFIYDIRAHLKVGVSADMMNTVAGLCGFYSGTESDDRRKPDGKQAITTKEFGDSWVVEGSPNCEPVICPVEMMTKALEICNQLREDPFTACADVVSVDTFVQFCMMSTCECLKQGNKPEEKCKCDSFLPLVETCEKEIGIKPLRSWRFKHSCAPECAPGLTWDDCGPSCQLTCDRLTMEDCSADCMAGCFCPPGTVLNEDQCVPPDHCSDKVCQGFGDPHLETYDGLFYAFQAEGTFLVSSDSNLTFSIEAITEKCNRFVSISCVTGIQVIFNGHRVQMRRNRLVKLDQRSIPMEKLPVVSDGMIILGFPGRTFVTLIPELSIEVRYYEENSGFAIKIPSQRYFNRTLGLCGNCNRKLHDELQNNPLSEFVCSWLTNGDEDSCQETFKQPDRGTGPVRICDNLEDEIFSSCHPLVDPDKYIKACSYDASHSADEVGSFCKTAMEYARQCCQAGEIINNWPEIFGCNVTCPEGLEFVQCHDACPQTCDSQLKNSPEVNCRSLKVDGCFCPEGTILKNGKCTETKSCETCDSEGHVPGDTWNDGPCKTCHCSETLTVDCTVEVCPLSPVCAADEVLTKNEAEEGSCCESFRCVKAPKECPDLEVPSCPEGQVAKVKNSDDYCPLFQCECDPLLCPPVVQPNLRDLEEGEVARLVNDTCCLHSVVECEPEHCQEEPSCAAGLELTEIPGKCCTIYKCKPPKDVCVYTHEFSVINGFEVQKDLEDLTPSRYQPGETWKDGLCTNCSCAEVQGQFVPRCIHEQCPSFENVFDNKDYELHEYTAKFKCCPDVFRLYCKDEAGSLYTEGEEWEDADDSCIKYLCQASFIGDVQKVKKVIECPTCPETAEYIPPSKKLGQCCGICTPSKCDEDGTIYSVGDTWVPQTDQCQKAECVNVGGTPKVIYTNPSCPSVPDDCPRDKIMQDEKGCCNVCNVTSEIHCSTVPIPLEETVGLFSDYDVYYGGKCVNEEPVADVLICSGACHSESYYSLEDGDFKSVCKCCKVNITVNRTVEVRCPDGRLVEKTFLQPETCQCSKCAPEAKKPWEKYQRQFQVEQEQSETWGNTEVEQQPWNVGQVQQEENDYDFLDK